MVHDRWLPAEPAVREKGKKGTDLFFGVSSPQAVSKPRAGAQAQSPVSKHNTGTQAEAVPKDTGRAQTEKTEDRRPEQRHTQPNNRLQATANSLRSFLASAIGGA